jgi:phage terminase Nu1 subunit (DNA packaging protein)
LRPERQQSSRTQADADHVKVKTEMRQLRLVEKKRELVRRTDVDALIDEIAGTVLTHLSGMTARCSRDMLGRRNIDAMVTQIRRDISDACSQAADARNEPLLDEQ